MGPRLKISPLLALAPALPVVQTAAATSLAGGMGGRMQTWSAEPMSEMKGAMDGRPGRGRPGGGPQGRSRGPQRGHSLSHGACQGRRPSGAGLCLRRRGPQVLPRPPSKVNPGAWPGSLFPLSKAPGPAGGPAGPGQGHAPRPKAYFRLLRRHALPYALKNKKQQIAARNAGKPAETEKPPIVQQRRGFL
jgi:hypothetical protein